MEQVGEGYEMARLVRDTMRESGRESMGRREELQDKRR